MPLMLCALCRGRSDDAGYTAHARCRREGPKGRGVRLQTLAWRWVLALGDANVDVGDAEMRTARIT